MVEVPSSNLGSPTKEFLKTAFSAKIMRFFYVWSLEIPLITLCYLSIDLATFQTAFFTRVMV
jgi:hypothetical protein